MKPTTRYLLFVLFSAVVLTIPVVSYVPIEEHNGIKYKFYTDIINKTEIIEFINTVPEEYTENLNIILIKEHRHRYCGLYWDATNRIDIYVNCPMADYKTTIIHELAHHNDPTNGFFSKAHDKDFWDTYDKIKSEVE